MTFVSVVALEVKEVILQLKICWCSETHSYTVDEILCIKSVVQILPLIDHDHLPLFLAFLQMKTFFHSYKFGDIFYSFYVLLDFI